MIYKASLDTFTKVVTIVVFIIFITLGGFMIMATATNDTGPSMAIPNSIFLLVFSGTFIFTWLYAPKSYTLENDMLCINRSIGQKKINLTDITEIRVVTKKDMGWLIRTFGVGGLFGYFGYFYSSKLGSLIFYATKRSNSVFIRTSIGRNIIITPDDLSMVADLQKRIN